MAIGNRACIVDGYAGDGWIDPVMLKRNGADAICLKGGQGSIRDLKFRLNWANARGVLPRQMYWLLDPRATLEDHIYAILSALGDDPGEMPPLQDYEENKALGLKLAPISWLPKIDQAIVSEYKRPTMIYSNQNYWTMGGGLTFAWGATRDLFAAQYPYFPNPETGSPRLFAPWKTWRAWQYTDHGTMEGMESKSRDISVFNGTVAEMNSWIAKLIVIPPPPVEPTDAQKLALVWAWYKETHP